MDYIIGVDVGGTKVAIRIIDQDSNKVATYSTKTISDSAEDFVSGVIQAIHHAMSMGNVQSSQIQGIGIGIPGMIDKYREYILMATNLAVKEPLAFRSLMQDEFNCPVFIENDVRLATFGIHHYRQIDNIAYLNLGTGVALGLVSNGYLYSGHNGLAGEIGQITITTPQNEITTLECVISGTGVSLQAKSIGLGDITAVEVYDLSKQGNELAQQLVKQTSQQIARTIELIFLFYDVETVVLGGGITKAGEVFRQPLLEALHELQEMSPFFDKLMNDTKILIMDRAFDSGTWGAIRFAQQQLENATQHAINQYNGSEITIGSSSRVTG